MTNQCPDCHSHSVQSKGYRTKGVHRYLCMNCGRNFTVRDVPIETKRTGENMGAKEEMIDAHNAERANQTLNVTRDIKDKLVSLKIYERETINDVIKRLIASFEQKKDLVT